MKDYCAEFGLKGKISVQHAKEINNDVEYLLNVQKHNLMKQVKRIVKGKRLLFLRNGENATIIGKIREQLRKEILEKLKEL